MLSFLQYNKVHYLPKLEARFPITVVVSPYSVTKLSPANEAFRGLEFACLPIGSATHWFFHSDENTKVLTDILDNKQIKFTINKRILTS